MTERLTDQPIPRIGVDIGRVITAAVTDERNSIFDADNYLSAPVMEGAIETMADVIVSDFGTENVYLVSKCGPTVQHRTSRWLEHIDFFNRTGVNQNNVFYCLQRSEKSKIAERLKLTHFIDDREDVFDGMANDQVTLKMHFLPEAFSADDGLVHKRGQLFVVNGWAGVRAALSVASIESET